MNTKIKQNSSLFFCSLLLVLQLVNALHFVLIDHTIAKENGIKVINHQCDDYVLYPLFTSEFPSQEISIPQWNNYFSTEETLYHNYYASVYNSLINNKGPPFEEKNYS